MSSGGSSGGSAFGLVVVVFILVAMVPKAVWIAIGVAIGIAVLGWAAYRINADIEKKRAVAEERARVQRAERAAREKQQRIDTLGARNAELVESALLAVRRVAESEAARAGWLGDVDFSADINGVTANFEKAHALRGMIDKLAALTNPSAADRAILADARTTVAGLERSARERVELIGKCATEAQSIDHSLCTEREDARVAEQRAELHAKLSGMLYGIEAAPTTTPADSAVDAVMARVQAYREIKNQIQQAADGG